VLEEWLGDVKLRGPDVLVSGKVRMAAREVEVSALDVSRGKARFSGTAKLERGEVQARLSGETEDVASALPLLSSQLVGQLGASMDARNIGRLAHWAGEAGTKLKLDLRWEGPIDGRSVVGLRPSGEARLQGSSWSLVAKVDHGRLTPSDLEIRRHDGSHFRGTLEEASRPLRTSTPNGGVLIKGEVAGLKFLGQSTPMGPLTVALDLDVTGADAGKFRLLEAHGPGWGGDHRISGDGHWKAMVSGQPLFEWNDVSWEATGLDLSLLSLGGGKGLRGIANLSGIFLSSPAGNGEVVFRGRVSARNVEHVDKGWKYSKAEGTLAWVPGREWRFDTLTLESASKGQAVNYRGQAKLDLQSGALEGYGRASPRVSVQLGCRFESPCVATKVSGVSGLGNVSDQMRRKKQ